MSGSCVYLVTVNGTGVPVEAANQSQAIRIATRPLVTGCRPLKGNEVLELYKAGTPVLTAKGVIGGPDDPEFDEVEDQQEPAAFDPPAEPGKFEGDTAFMNPEEPLVTTHVWTNGEWLRAVRAVEDEQAPDASKPGPGEEGEIPLKGAARRGRAAPDAPAE